MAAGWTLAETVDAADAERLREHLAQGEARPALVVRLEPLIAATPGTDGLDLLMAGSPDGEDLIRRLRLRVGSHLTAIVHGGMPVLGELVGSGPAAEADEATWKALQERHDAQARERGWLVRPADGPPGSVAEPLDRSSAGRPVVIIVEETVAPPPPPPRRWGWLLFGVILVVLLTLLLEALRRRF
jgi:hypothetical protein